MGLPIFFEPSVPDSPSKETEKSTSGARSAIRRHPLRGNRPVYHARRRRAYLDNYERDTNSLELFQHLYQQQSIRPSARVSITTSTRDAMREAMREHSLSAVPPSLSFERQSSRGAEADGPLMPAVPESRDYPNPPIGDPQGPPRILRTSVISISPYPETDTHSVSRPSGDMSTSEVDDRNMGPNTGLAESVDGMDAQDSLSRRDHLGRHARHVVRERFRELEEQRSLAREREEAEQRRLVREREEAEREREGRQRELNIRRQERSILDEEMREGRRVERRLEERRLDENRDRQRLHNREVRRLNEFREQLRVDRERLQDDIERLRSERDRLQSGTEQIEERPSSGSEARQQSDTSLARRELREQMRVDSERLEAEIEQLRNERDRLRSGREQIEESLSSNSEERQQADTSLAGREQVQRSDAPSTGERERLLEQLEVEAYGRGVMQSGLEEADSFIININYDGLGDRERSHDEFQEPEPAYRDIGGLEVVDNVEQLERLDAEGHGSWDGLLITPDPQSPNPSSSFASTAASSSQRPSMSTSISSLHESQPLTNGDCDTALDSETEDELAQQGLEWFRRPRTNRTHGRGL
ncbi:588f2f38-d53c-4cb1-a0f5-c9360ccb199b [Sclerotinia trifoliorum]|uniref:588f2f38-d53c-4cb1-a0f5-c9360ccb199b n=1 Tax=Sclerotinia trifoliorum TaxID=28548 RepID=A0A8H2ZKQ8_9HELO|nr:588f2f38-d53c-4cb1-a0f5-c9360ccb199b [Sclerotinia trifoliorum]